MQKSCPVDETYKLPIPKERRKSLKISDKTRDELLAANIEQKLKRVRPEWEDLDGFIEHKQDELSEIEYNWTEGAAGFSQMKDMVIICGSDRTKLISSRIGMFGGSIARSSSSFDISMVNQRYMGRRLYTKFGQGCQYVWRTANTRTELITRNVYLAPIFRNDGVDIAIFTLQNEILSLFDVIFLTDDATYGWITIDPISRCLFFCPSYDVSLSSEARFFSIYNIVPLDNGRLTFTELNSAMVNSPITNCTGGCFSDNGILYLLNNDDDNTGFSAYTFNYNQYLPGYVFNKVKDYRVYTPDESIWSSDNQDLVGIGYFSFSNQSRFLGILHRNEDIGDDNISYTMVQGLM